MTTWTAGMTVTAGRLNDGVTPTVTTTGLVAQTGFTVGSFVAYKIGHLVSFYALINSTNAISASGGNLADTAVATLPAGWWPLDQVNACFGNGSMDGEFIIDSSGVITLRSAVATIAAGTNLRFANTYVYAT